MPINLILFRFFSGFLGAIKPLFYVMVLYSWKKMIWGLMFLYFRLVFYPDAWTINKQGHLPVIYAKYPTLSPLSYAEQSPVQRISILTYSIPYLYSSFFSFFSEIWPVEKVLNESLHMRFSLLVDDQIDKI